MKDLNLFDTIYQMYAVLNLLFIHEREKNDILLLFLNQNPLIYCHSQGQLAPHLDCLLRLISYLENAGIIPTSWT